MAIVLEPDLIWLNHKFEPRARLKIDPKTGRILATGNVAPLDGSEKIIKMPGMNRQKAFNTSFSKYSIYLSNVIPQNSYSTMIALQSSLI